MTIDQGRTKELHIYNLDQVKAKGIQLHETIVYSTTEQIFSLLKWKLFIHRAYNDLSPSLNTMSPSSKHRMIYWLSSK